MLGALKCGTTALASYLATRPLIQVSEPKEPNYFCKDLLAGGFPVASDEEYLATFFPGLGESKAHVALDASVWYLYSGVAVDEILRFRPDARFLVMIRSPVDMAYSLHSMLHFMGQEDVFDFARAWQLQDARRQGRFLPVNRWVDAQCLQYHAVCSLGSQLERLYQKVDPARVHVELQDDMRKDPRGVYARVLNFLGVPDDGRTQFDETNAGHKLNSRSLATALRSRPALHAVKAIKRMTGIKTLGFGRPDLPMKLEQREFLTEAFRQEIVLLENLLKRDLTQSWLPASEGRGDRNKVSASEAEI